MTKITIGNTRKKYRITYPTKEQAVKALTVLTRISGNRIFIPCDIMSGKTQKIADLRKWSVINV